MKVFLLKLKFIIGLLTWQLSLVVVAIGLMGVSGIIVVASPQTVEGIQDTAVGIAKATFSDVSTIKLGNDIEDVEIFVYDNITGETDRPLDIDILKDKNDYFFELYPGAYKIVFFKDGFEPVEKNVVIDVGSEVLKFNLNYRSEDSSEDINIETDFLDEVEKSSNLKKIDEDDIQKHSLEIEKPSSGTTDSQVSNDKADLEVVSLSYYDRQNGGDVIIWAEIENSGDDYSEKFDYKIFYENQNGTWKETVSDSYAYELSPSSSSEIWIDWKLPEGRSNAKIRLELDTSNNVNESLENNNVEYMTIDIDGSTSTQRTDLKVVSVNVYDKSNGDYVRNLKTGSDYYALAEIKNEGDVNIEGYKISWEIDPQEGLGGNEKEIEYSDVIKPGQSIKYRFEWRPGFSGKNEVKVMIDSGNTVVENNENNNFHTTVVEVE